MGRTGLVLALLLAAFSVVAVAGQAQLAQVDTNVDLSLPNQPAPIAPGSVTYFQASVRYTWGQGFAPTSTTLRIEVLESPPWANVTFNRTEIQVDTSSRFTQGGAYGDIVNLTVAVAPNAPAFSQGLVRARITADENPPLRGATDEAEFELQAGFRGTLQARLLAAPVNGTIAVRGGWAEHVAVELTNTGNGPQRVLVEATRPPAESQWETVEVVLDAGETRVVELPVRTPWRVTFEFPTEITVTPTHAQRGVAGEPVDLPFVLRGESLVPIPTVGGLVGPLVLVGLAVVGRRRSVR